MPWQDRVVDAAYTPQGGSRIVFQYENVRQALTLRGTAFEFPDANGTLVQRTGRTSRRYPMRAFFSGDDHDIEAEAFVQALSAEGRGRLEHPFYGTFDVVPFGDVTRRDDLKTAANQSVIEVTFFNDLGLVYPTSADDPASLTIAAVSEADEATATAFEDAISIATAIERVSIQNQVLSVLDDVESTLETIAGADPQILAQFTDRIDSVRNSIGDLVEKPGVLARQVSNAIRTAAGVPDDIIGKVLAYTSLSDTLTARSVSNTSDAATAGSPSNTFRTRDLFTTNYVTSAVSSTLAGELTTRPEAILNAERLIELNDSVTAWRDAEFVTLNEVDTGEAYEAMQRSVAVAAGYLVTTSFSLKQERRVVLDRPRNIVELAGELYGDPDGELDFLIATNALSGDEILELPKGRSIVYYV